VRRMKRLRARCLALVFLKPCVCMPSRRDLPLSARAPVTLAAAASSQVADALASDGRRNSIGSRLSSSCRLSSRKPTGVTGKNVR
jgi:hypothetical protein